MDEAHAQRFVAVVCLTRFGPKTVQNHNCSNVELAVTTRGVPHALNQDNP